MACTLRSAFASPALRADAVRYTPGETGETPAAAPARLPPAAWPSPASTSDASARAARSVPDAPPRYAPAQSPISSTTLLDVTTPPRRAKQTAHRYRSESPAADRIRETPPQRSPALVPRWSWLRAGTAASTGCAHR